MIYLGFQLNFIRMSINLDKLSNDVEYNILLIGEPGDGKSTFVNAFANYVKFSSFDAAMYGELEEVIPSKFVIEDSKTDKKIVIKSGSIENEKFNKRPRTQSSRIYTFCCNGKVIRLIDTPGWRYYYGNELYKKSLHTTSQCLAQFEKIHAIVWVAEAIYDEILFLQTIHKSAYNNVVFCYTNSLPNTSDEKTKLKSKMQNNTKIPPNHGQNLLSIDNCAFECFVAHRQGHTLSDERTNQCRSSWIEASAQIQTMLDWLGRAEPCEVTNIVELMKSVQIMELCREVILTYAGAPNKSTEISKIVNLLKPNPTEYERIEDICVQLWAMVIYSSVADWDSFKDSIEYFEMFYGNNENLVNFRKILSNIAQNRESFETKFSKFFATTDFVQLFTELTKLKHSGLYFTKEIAQITQPSNKFELKQITIQLTQSTNFLKYQTNLSNLVELQQILTIVTSNNLLLVRSAGTGSLDLSNATLHNVVFTCGSSTNEMKDFIVNQTHSNITETDIKFIVDNMDRLIKDNFDNLIPLIKNYSPAKLIVTNEQNKRNSSKTKPPTTFKSKPIAIPSQSTSHHSLSPSQSSTFSSFRPYMKNLYEHSDNPDNLSNDIDLVIEQLLKIKAKRANNQE